MKTVPTTIPKSFTTAEEIINLGLTLVRLCTTKTPNLHSVQKACEVLYEEERQHTTQFRVEFEPPQGSSHHLKATFLAILFFDRMIMKYRNTKILIDELIDPMNPKYSWVESQIFALRKVLQNLHVFQMNQEKIMGSEHRK